MKNCAAGYIQKKIINKISEKSFNKYKIHKKRRP